MNVHKHHPENQILGNEEIGVQTIRKLIDTSTYTNFALFPMVEHQNFAQALNQADDLPCLSSTKLFPLGVRPIIM
jgi:hypothetical protein